MTSGDAPSSQGTPVVYVSFNYRLGPLGLPPGREALAQNALNLAMKDQLAALRWVQDNIGLFNGDKDKVRCIPGPLAVRCQW